MDTNQGELLFKNPLLLVPSSATTSSQPTLKLNKAAPTKKEPIFTIKVLMSLLVAVVSALISSYIIYSSYKYTSQPNNIEEVTLIKRELGPLRIIPSDLGGEQFLNQDKLVYDNLESPELKGIKKQVIESSNKQENPVIKAVSKSMVVEEENEKKQTKSKQQNVNATTKLSTESKQTNKVVKATQQSKKNSVFDVLN